jgi:hypothetical protein
MDSNNNVFESIRWENFRDAIDDYEYIWLMNASIQAKGGDTEAQELLDSLVNQVVGDKYDYCASRDVILNARKQIGDWLSQQESAGLINTLLIGEANWNPPSYP